MLGTLFGLGAPPLHWIDDGLSCNVNGAVGPAGWKPAIQQAGGLRYRSGVTSALTSMGGGRSALLCSTGVCERFFKKTTAAVHALHVGKASTKGMNSMRNVGSRSG